MIGGTRNIDPAAWAYRPGGIGGSRAGRGRHYFELVKVLHVGLWVLRSHRAYFQPTRTNFFI